MALDRLPELTTRLADGYADLLGTFPETGITAIAVDPGFIPSQCVGIRCIIQRVPTQIVSDEKVGGGLYSDDLFKIELTAFYPFSAYQTDPQKADRLRSLLQAMRLDFNVANVRYIPPDGESYERAIILVNMPALILRN